MRKILPGRSIHMLRWGIFVENELGHFPLCGKHFWDEDFFFASKYFFELGIFFNEEYFFGLEYFMGFAILGRNLFC